MALLLTLISETQDGHRREYIALMDRIFREGGHDTKIVNSWKKALDQAPAFFLMIEENLLGYVFAAFFRSLMGRRTVGLLFRGREAAMSGSLQLSIKRTLLTLLRAVSKVETLSIVPFSVEPRLAKVADGWIDDPQLWDLEDTTHQDTPLSNEIRSIANGRKLVVSMGGQNESKGFRFLTDVYCSDSGLRDRWLFVTAGKVAEAELDCAAAFETAGGILIDRFISDPELASLYGVTDVIWGVYHPIYNQASGIFGRAVQYDVPILLRRGSMIAAHALQLGARAVSVDYGQTTQVETALDAALRTVPSGPALRIGMRQRNLIKLFNALIDEA
jgi:hypothetical protein